MFRDNIDLEKGQHNENSAREQTYLEFARICSYKIYIHKKTNIMQIMTNSITFFINLIFYNREIVKLDHFMDTFLELCKHRSVIQPVQNPPFCSSTKTVT